MNEIKNLTNDSQINFASRPLIHEDSSNDFLYLIQNSIPDTMCDNIINFFEEDTIYKRPGCTASGIDKNFKDTTDISIPKDDEKWGKIESFLYKELAANIKRYVKKINNIPEYKQNHNYNKDYKILDNGMFTRLFMIQKYKKNTGKFLYHNDFEISDDSYRVLTFLWYLNTVDEGGETVVWGNYKIKPEKGKLLLFPATWTYPHTGKMPISHDKYIITGWLYIPK